MSKKIIPKAKSADVTLYGSTDLLMSKALEMLRRDMENLYITVGHRALDEKEARKLMGYIKAIVDISKEQREIEKSNDITNMSDEELKALARKLLGEKHDV